MLSPDQRSAVEAPGSVAVVAGAGTGKTHMLTQRYIHHLQVDGLTPLQVVAVTFTEQAAAELRARIRKAVQLGHPLRDDWLAELEAAQISTIHALAARICRDHANVAGVPPDFRVLDNIEGQVWQTESLNAVLGALPQAHLEAFGYTSLRQVLTALLRDPLSGEAALSRGATSWQTLVAESRDEALSDLVAAPEWQASSKVVRICQGAAGDRAEQARQTVLKALECLTDRDMAGAKAHFDQIDLRGGSAKNWSGDSLQNVKDAIKQLRGRFEDALDDGIIDLTLTEVDTHLEALLPIIRESFQSVRDQLAALKRRERVLDFADLEVYALQALKDSRVRAHYAERWHALLVDEFQDTNEVQGQLLQALSENVRLTIVGDDKQSIYGFRRADVSVFRRYREMIAGNGGKEVILTRSFRTHEPLLSTINATFAPLFGEQHQPLTATREQPPHAAPHLTLQLVSKENGALKAARRLAEVHVLANLLQSMIGQLPVVDRQTGVSRPAQARDIAVLTRTWAPLDVYSEVLPALGVAAIHTGGGNLLETREAKDGWALLRFLSDPHDNLALAAVLRSPFIALSDPELYTFVQSLEGHEVWWPRLVQQTPEGERWQHAVGVMTALLEMRYEHSASELLALADSLTGYTAVLANLTNAARREADWRGFVDFIRHLASSRDLFGVVRTLRRLTHAKAEVPRLSIDAGEAVTLSTIHSAKGLEWPIVIVADLDTRLLTTPPEVLIDPDLGVACTFTGEHSESLKPALYTLMKWRLRQREAEEQRRLYYVALTRARDRLVLSAAAGRGGALDMLLPALVDAGISADHIPFNVEHARYPDGAPVPPVYTLADDLWCTPVAAPQEVMTPNTTSPQVDWKAVCELTASFDEQWLALIEGLASSGVPAPTEDNVFVDLMIDGQVSGTMAILQWTRGDIRIALVERGTPRADYGATVIEVVPETDISPLAAQLTMHLQGGEDH